MIALVLLMLLSLLVAAAVVVYVAFPHRGEEVPGAPWLGEAMSKGVASVRGLGADAPDEPEHDHVQR